MKLEVKGLRFGYNSNPVLKEISILAFPGRITAVVGPNAVGKSTLLKCIAGMIKPDRGSILLDGKDIRDFKRDITRYVYYLSQEDSTKAVLTVFETVLLGRIHSLSWRISTEDAEIASKVLQDIGISELATRFLDELSAGQRQMVFIAQSLVRDPKVLLLDEPTSNLDLQHQLDILDLIKDITADREITTLITSHDLNLVARYVDEFIVLNAGNVYASGKPESVLTPEMIRDVYKVNARVNMIDGIPQLTPVNSVKAEIDKKGCSIT